MARPRQVSDAQILEAARACFLEQGASVSTTVIAKRLGVSQAALFKRFGTKEELLLAALRPGPEMVRPLLDWLEQGPNERPIPAQILELGENVRSFFGRLLPRIAQLRAAGHGPPHCGKGRPIPPQLVHQALAAWLHRAQEQGRVRPCDTEAAAFALLGALNLQAFLEFSNGKQPAADLSGEIEPLVEILWRGLDPERSAP